MARRFTVRKAKVGWKRRMPKTRGARRELLAKCGTKCFLVPKHKGAPGFPVCVSLKKSKGRCQIDCEGLRAGFARAKQTRRTKAAKKAVRMACRAGCKWTQAAARCSV